MPDDGRRSTSPTTCSPRTPPAWPPPEPVDLSEPAADRSPTGPACRVDALPREPTTAFDRVARLDDAGRCPPAPVPPAGAAADDDDWDFLIEEPEADAGEADLNVDLDQPHGH